MGSPLNHGLYMTFFVIVCLSFNVDSLLDPPNNNMTKTAFGDHTNFLPAAFGDFNSDELTDMFVLQDNRKTLQILLGADSEPMLRPADPPLVCKYSKSITSVVPGDFNGDALMDVMLTFSNTKEKEFTISEVIVLWGNVTRLECSSESEPLIKVKDQPLSLFYSTKDVIVDLFGETPDNVRMFWEFNSNKSIPPKPIPLINENSYEAQKTRKNSIRFPHSNAFLDLNNDNAPDLFITTKLNFEIWYYDVELSNFRFAHAISLPPGFVDLDRQQVGQSLFLDVELKGKMDHVLPVCFDRDDSSHNYCKNGTIFVYSDDKWHNLKTNFLDGKKTMWGFAKNNGLLFTDTITMRGGDFNMDGYPDLLVTLANTETTRVFFFENAPCTTSCEEFEREFIVRWDALNPMNNDTVLGVFYDMLQDGILDVLLVNVKNQKYSVSAFKNNLDYDANFLKVMVITPLKNDVLDTPNNTLTKHKRTPGTNLPGPKISYNTSTPEGLPRKAISVQLPQSAHFALGLPYNIFGLGRTPNFIEYLGVGLWGESRSWSFLIPNSQVVVIPSPQDLPDQWKTQLFVTPSKLVLQSVLALVATCFLIVCTIGVLYYKERREDRLERLREAHRFHFDAM